MKYKIRVPDVLGTKLANIELSSFSFMFEYLHEETFEYKRLEQRNFIDSTYCYHDKDGFWDDTLSDVYFSLEFECHDLAKAFANLSEIGLGIGLRWDCTSTKVSQVISLELENNRYVINRLPLLGAKEEITFFLFVYVKECSNEQLALFQEPRLLPPVGTYIKNLKKWKVQLNGTAKPFPVVYDVLEDSSLLWKLECEYEDPFCDSFYDAVRIVLNMDSPSIDLVTHESRSSFCLQAYVEVLAEALCILITKLKYSSSHEDWARMCNSSEGSVNSIASFIYYYRNTLEWQLDNPVVLSEQIRWFLLNELEERCEEH